MDFKQKTNSILKFIAKPYILFYALPWLMILLVLGTIAQKEIGLYEAHKVFFSSWILFLGPIPLPGGLLTLGLIFLTLLVKFIFFSEWNLKQSGIILTHFGVLVLLFGGLITSKYAHESFMVIPEEKTISNTSEYRERDITLSKNNEIISHINIENLKSGEIFKENSLPFNLTADFICNNCSMKYQDSEIAKTAHGMAKKVELIQIPSEKEPEANLSGAMIEIKNAEKNINGRYILMENVSDEINIKSNNKIDTYSLKIGRVQNPLPFSIKLNDFRRIVYPGTNKPKAFESDIIIKDKDLEWPITISMNKPARYKGYTFYQSSFMQNPSQEITILNVVNNIGRIFPYIASFIMFLGLSIHSIIKFKEHTKSHNRGKK